MTFGVTDWGCDEKVAHAIMKNYIHAGGNAIDSADVYAGGKAEEIIGSFLSQIKRDDVISCLKVLFPHGQPAKQLWVFLESMSLPPAKRV